VIYRYLLLVVSCLFIAGCVSTSSSGLSGHLGTALTAAQEVSKASRPISDEEEYYIGRALAAKILTTYRIYNNTRIVDYVNLVGFTIAMHSERPTTYGGYHFAILDTHELNAFACPGGLIFITKGMLQAAKNEDELAAILAHEIAHINHKDGIASIKSARWTEALTVIGTQAVKQYSSAEVGKLLNIFEGVLDDVFKTIVVNGYSQQQEFAADEKALLYLKKAGYNPSALTDFITFLNRQGTPSQGGIMKTHPSSAERLENLMGKASVGMDNVSFNKRTERFRALMKRYL